MRKVNCGEATPEKKPGAYLYACRDEAYNQYTVVFRVVSTQKRSWSVQGALQGAMPGKMFWKAVAHAAEIHSPHQPVASRSSEAGTVMSR